MKRLIQCLCLLCLINGCYCQRAVKNESLLPQDISTSSSVQTNLKTDAEKTSTPPTKPASQTVIPAKPVITTPAVSANSTAKPKETVSKPTAVSSTNSTSEKSQQMQNSVQPIPPAKPAPDKAVFADEPLINLNDRLLNPLAALVPGSTAHMSDSWKSEQLKYGIYYSFVKAGTAYIKNRGLVTVDGRPAYVIQTSAFSASVIDSVFKLRDINLSWLDAQNFYSLGYSQSLREGKYKRDEWVRFDYAKKKYYGQVKKKAGPRDFSGELMQPVLDMLTSLYYVRSKPLEPGKEVVFDIINREEKYPLVVKVLGKETVKTEAGKFKCIIVEPQFRGEGIFVSKGKDLKVWVTDDEYKMPVKMKVEVFIGSVSAELLEYKRN